MRRVGVDLLREQRLDALCAYEELLDDPFVRATLSERERSDLAVTNRDRRVHFLATRLALKEAAYKCLHLDDEDVQALQARLGRRPTLSDLEVTQERDWPELTVAPDLARALGVTACEVSLSYDDGLVVAVAMMELKDTPAA